ncbi:hypothetical protein [Bordetella hinzii]|uniref:hypothetical protein n=1 Tax=Bordetella hinzii TaxID=103855 RepID=UPI0012D31ABA|nr:hypothetical protein [Bordetella hinzii]
MHNRDKFHGYANKITSAGDYLLDHGFKAHQVVENSQAFLALVLVESRIVRQCRQTALDEVMKNFNEYGQAMVLKGLELAAKNRMTEQDIVACAQRNNTHQIVYNNPWLDSCLASLLTYAAIAYEAKPQEI